MHAVIELVRAKKLRLVSSSVIEFENSFNPFPERKAFVVSILELASEYGNYAPQMAKRARELQRENDLTRYDARHIATAEAVGADFFITSDVGLLKKYAGALRVVDPLAFFQQYGDYTKNTKSF